MRTATLVLLAGFALGVFTPAQAADLDYGVLRGPDYEPEVPLIDWGGVYFGGHGGYTSANVSMRNAYTSVMTDLIGKSTAGTDFTTTSLIGPSSRRAEGASYGIFAGFNYQFDEAVVGVEADYTRFDKSASIFDETAHLKFRLPGYYENTHLAGVAQAQIENYGTIRVRGGYAIGNFLPFLTAGLAVGQIHTRNQAHYANYGYDEAAYRTNQQNSQSVPLSVDSFGYAKFDANKPESSTPNITTSIIEKNRLAFGLALGAGLEYALTQNIILRGEYQYILFDDTKTNLGGRAAMNTVRGGAAIKF